MKAATNKQGAKIFGSNGTLAVSTEETERERQAEKGRSSLSNPHSLANRASLKHTSLHYAICEGLSQ